MLYKYREAKNGDKDAMRKLIRSLIQLLHKYANKFRV